MKQIYFCNPETAKKTISKIEDGCEYECFIYENHCVIDFGVVGHAILNFEVPFVTEHGCVGDRFSVEVKNGPEHVRIDGQYYYSGLLETVIFFGFGIDFIDNIAMPDNPSCPLVVLDTVNHEQIDALEAMLPVNEGLEDEW